MASFTLKLFLLLVFISYTFASSPPSSSSSSSLSSTLDPNLTSIRSFCKTTPYPQTCFNSLKLGISINISPNILTYLLQSLQVAISEATHLSDLFHNAGGGSGSSNLVERQRGSIQDCRELHLSTLTSLKRSLSGVRDSPTSSRKLANARAYLSAAMTNKNTCLEGLDSATGSLKPLLVDSTIEAYKHVSNSLSMLPQPEFGGSRGHKNRRRLLGAPAWLKKGDRRILDGGQLNDDMIVVAADGSGNFSTISEAVNFAPNNSLYRTMIYVKAGTYKENVEIPSYKTNLVLLGDGSDVTLITGHRSVGDGWTTFRSATLAVSGDGFLARDIAIENTAGPEKHQAVALRINADLTALYKCAVYGYQDTLYVHSFRQFYRECDIYGTIDFIFGNAAVVFQDCDVVSRKPMPHQFTVVTAQSRDSPDEDTGISFQNCSIIATQDLYNSSKNSFKSYLGRPWRPYSRTVYLESYIDDFVDPKGWTEWSDPDGDDTETVYYGEYQNYGPGSGTGGRVDWAGYHVMGYDEAYNFTVTPFIMGDAWLQSTSFPYDAGI